jgi:histone acetyltransferase (RNA polymerase elongator complex component)
MSESPLILPVFLPHLGCRERCIFCNQKMTVPEAPSPFSVGRFLAASLGRLPAGKNGRKKQIAFYGGSFTAMDPEDQIGYLREARSVLTSGRIDSVRISTRPDALSEKTLALLKDYGVRTVELGAQSMIDEVLLASDRGHRAEDTVAAVSRLKAWGFEVGLHLMMGLPHDTEDYFSETLDCVVELKPDFVRVHPTLVLRGSGLQSLWESGMYSPLSLDGTVQWLKKAVLKLERASIPVARIGLQPSKELEDHLLAGPYHPALRQLVESALFFDMASFLLSTYPGRLDPVFHCHPSEISNLRGQKNTNITTLEDRFGLKRISIEAKESLPKKTIALPKEMGETSVHWKDLKV